MTSVNADFPLRNQGMTNTLSADALPRHRWYHVKEGFSPALVEHAIDAEGIAPGELLLDPFSGSGTSALAGVGRALRVEGFEVNPFLWSVSTAKVSSPRAKDLRAAASRVLRATQHPLESPLEGYSTFTTGNPWNRWLFPLSVIRAFEAGRQKALGESRGARSLLKLALIGAAMDCCNATRDGKCLRYRSGWARRQLKPESFRDRFEERIEQIAIDTETTPLSSHLAHIIKGDARKLVMRSGRKFRLCVTSPPYLNSFDYSDVYRPELFLGGFVTTTDQLMKVRLKTLRSHVQANWKAPTKDQFGTLYQECMRELKEQERDLWSARLPFMVQAYFEDMETVLRGLRTRAAKVASLWLVVSTSAYAGVEVPVDLILAEIGQRAGWFLREIGVLRYLRSASQHVRHVEDVAKKSVPLRESLVIFDTIA
jgi:hypothetical protein